MVEFQRRGDVTIRFLLIFCSSHTNIVHRLVTVEYYLKLMVDGLISTALNTHIDPMLTGSIHKSLKDDATVNFSH